MTIIYKTIRINETSIKINYFLEIVGKYATVRYRKGSLLDHRQKLNR